MPAKKINCQICGNIVADEEGPNFPFCSQKCKLVDLEAWLSGRYYVIGEPIDVREGKTDEKANDTAPGGTNPKPDNTHPIEQ